LWRRGRKRVAPQTSPCAKPSKNDASRTQQKTDTRILDVKIPLDPLTSEGPPASNTDSQSSQSDAIPMQPERPPPG